MRRRYPAYKRCDDDKRGRHLIATREIAKNEVIFVERPLASLQSVVVADQPHSYSRPLCCRYCRAYCGDAELAIQFASGRFKRERLMDHCGSEASRFHIIPCRNGCGEVYCSEACEQTFWDAGGHAILCTGILTDDEAPTHPLYLFKLHAVANNEILLMVADVVVSALLRPTLLERYQDFTMVPWWTVVAQPLSRNPMAVEEIAALDKSTRQLCVESSSLLDAVLERHGGIVTDDRHKLCSPEFFGKLIGSFEQNALGIRNRHPLCREILETRELRERYWRDIVECLRQAGMIGTGEDNEHEVDEEAKVERVSDEGTGVNGVDDDIPDHFTDQQGFDDEDITNFLTSSLEIDETGLLPEGDDLDEVFSPLDGTAMYSMICKMNHSCEPNVVVLYRTHNWSEPLVAHAIAQRDIAEGEELFISYLVSDDPYEERQQQVANYGFVCQCAKCEREKNNATESHSQMEQEEEGTTSFDSMFGEEDEHEEDDEHDEAPESVAPLDSLLESLDEVLNSSEAPGSLPLRLLGQASSFVLQMTSSEQDAALPCREALMSRDFIACKRAGLDLEKQLWTRLKLHGSFLDDASRQLYHAACVTAATGLTHLGSFLQALCLLDKAMVLGLERQSTVSSLKEFLDYAEHFANEMADAPLPLSLEAIVPDVTMENAMQVLPAPLACPVAEAGVDMGSVQFHSDFVHTQTPCVIRGLGKDWSATRKWKNLLSIVEKHGHRMVPIELGSMLQEGGMKETFLSLQEYAVQYLEPSCKHGLWSLQDAISAVPGRKQQYQVAYMAQHALLDQIPSLATELDKSPKLCGESGPSRINVWMGTGGTRTPLHFDSYDNLLVQVVGAKYVRIYAREETEKLYVIQRNGALSAHFQQGNMSELDVELEDWEKHPLARNAVYQECLLFPGDCLFIPSRAWHYVRSLTTSVSVNYWW